MAKKSSQILRQLKLTIHKFVPTKTESKATARGLIKCIEGIKRDGGKQKPEPEISEAERRGGGGGGGGGRVEALVGVTTPQLSLRSKDFLSSPRQWTQTPGTAERQCDYGAIGRSRVRARLVRRWPEAATGSGLGVIIVASSC